MLCYGGIDGLLDYTQSLFCECSCLCFLDGVGAPKLIPHQYFPQSELFQAVTQLFSGLFNPNLGEFLFELARISYGFHCLRLVPRFLSLYRGLTRGSFDQPFD